RPGRIEKSRFPARALRSSRVSPASDGARLAPCRLPDLALLRAIRFLQEGVARCSVGLFPRTAPPTTSTTQPPRLSWRFLPGPRKPEWCSPAIGRRRHREWALEAKAASPPEARC